MRLLFILTLLAFPVAEIWILIELASHYGWKVLLYLIVVAVLGIRLIADEKQRFTGRMMQSMMQGQHPMKAMFGSARNIIAGILLVIPGVMTDVIAAVLLLIPVKSAGDTGTQYTAPDASEHATSRRKYQSNQAANDDVIEGEFRRED